MAGVHPLVGARPTGGHARGFAERRSAAPPWRGAGGRTRARPGTARPPLPSARVRARAKSPRRRRDAGRVYAGARIGPTPRPGVVHLGPAPSTGQAIGPHAVRIPASLIRWTQRGGRGSCRRRVPPGGGGVVHSWAPSAWRCYLPNRSHPRAPLGVPKRCGPVGRQASRRRPLRPPEQRRRCRRPTVGRHPPASRARRRSHRWIADRHRLLPTGPGSLRPGPDTRGRSCRFPRSPPVSARRRTRSGRATGASTSSAWPASPCSRPAPAPSSSRGRSAPGASCRWTTTTACAPPTSRCGPSCGRARWCGPATCSGCWNAAIPAVRRHPACTGAYAAGPGSTWTR
jgi:hypothetical protein